MRAAAVKRRVARRIPSACRSLLLTQRAAGKTCFVSGRGASPPYKPELAGIQVLRGVGT